MTETNQKQQDNDTKPDTRHNKNGNEIPITSNIRDFYIEVTKLENHNWAGRQALYPEKSPISLIKIISLAYQMSLDVSSHTQKNEMANQAKNELEGLKTSYHYMYNAVINHDIFIETPEFIDSLYTDHSFFEGLSNVIKITVENLRTAKIEGNKGIEEIKERYDSSKEKIRTRKEKELTRITEKKKGTSWEKIVSNLALGVEGILGYYLGKLTGNETVMAIGAVFGTSLGAMTTKLLNNATDRYYDNKYSEKEIDFDLKVEQEYLNFENARKLIDNEELTNQTKHLARLQIEAIVLMAKKQYTLDICEEAPYAFYQKVESAVTNKNWDEVNQITTRAKYYINNWAEEGYDLKLLEKTETKPKPDENGEQIAKQMAVKAISRCSVEMAEKAIIDAGAMGD